MDNFADNWYTLGKIGLGKQTLGNFTNGNLTLGTFTQVYLPWINLPKVFNLGYGIMQKLNYFNDLNVSEFNNDSCVKVLYT